MQSTLDHHDHSFHLEPRGLTSPAGTSSWVLHKAETIEPKASMEWWKVGAGSLLPRALRQAVRFAAATHEASIRLFNHETWDDLEGGRPEALPMTWARASSILQSLPRQLQGLDVPPPDLSAGDDGSIDMLWRWDEHRILIHVPPSAQTLRITAKRPSGERKSAEIKYDGRTVVDWSDVVWGFKA